MRFLACLFIAACSSSPDPIDGVDAESDAPKLGEKDAGVDALEDASTSTDSGADVGVDATPNDAGADVQDAAIVIDAAPDVVVLGGDICPGVGLCKGACSCDAGYKHQWSVEDPDGGTSYLCENGGAPTNPECPTGWMCSGYNASNQFVTKICP